MLIADILHDNQIDYLKLFSESGLLYFRNSSFNAESNLNVSAYSSYYDLRLKEFYGINMSSEIFDSIEKYQIEITKNIAKKNFIIKLDNFFLPYSKAFQKKHMVHALRIIAENCDEYLVCDNYYGYKDWLRKDTILKGIEEYKKLPLKNSFGPFLIFDLCFENSKNISEKDIVTKNFRLMTEESAYCVEGYFNDLDKYVGVSAIKKMKEDFNNQLHKKDYFSIEELTEVAMTIQRSRRQASDYFNKINVLELKNAYYQCYSSWSIVAILLMKIYVRKTCSTLEIDRINLQYNIILTKEKDLINALRNKQ
nr:hypothetical protein [Enterococcus sp. DIV0212c]